MEQREIDISFCAGKEVVQEYFKKHNIFLDDECITATRDTLTYTIPPKFIDAFLDSFGYCSVKYLEEYIKYDAILCQCHISLPIEEGRAICFVTQADVLPYKLEDFINGNRQVAFEVDEDNYNLMCCQGTVFKIDLRIANDINSKVMLLKSMDKIINR